MKRRIRYLAIVMALVLSVSTGLTALAATGSDLPDDSGTAVTQTNDSTPVNITGDNSNTGDITSANEDTGTDDSSGTNENTGTDDSSGTNEDAGTNDNSAANENAGTNEKTDSVVNQQSVQLVLASTENNNEQTYAIDDPDWYTSISGPADFEASLSSSRLTTADESLLDWGWLYGEDVTTETVLYGNGYSLALEGGSFYEIAVYTTDGSDNLMGYLFSDDIDNNYFRFSGEGDYSNFYLSEDTTCYLYLSNNSSQEDVAYHIYINQVSSSEITESGEVLAILWDSYLVTTWDKLDSFVTEDDFWSQTGVQNLGTLSGDLDMDVVVLSVEDSDGYVSGDARLMISEDGLNLGNHKLYGEENTAISILGGSLTAAGIDACEIQVYDNASVSVSGDISLDTGHEFFNAGNVYAAGSLTGGMIDTENGTLTVSGNLYMTSGLYSENSIITVGGNIAPVADQDVYGNVYFTSGTSAAVGGSLTANGLSVYGESNLTISGDVTTLDHIVTGDDFCGVDASVLTISGNATVSGDDYTSWGCLCAKAGSRIYIGQDVYVAAGLQLIDCAIDKSENPVSQIIIGSPISNLDTSETSNYISINGSTVDVAEIDAETTYGEGALHLNNATIVFHDSPFITTSSDGDVYTSHLYVYGTSILKGNAVIDYFHFLGGTVQEMTLENDTVVTDTDGVKWFRLTASQIASKLSVASLDTNSTYTVYSAQKNASFTFTTSEDSSINVWLPDDIVLVSVTSNTNTTNNTATENNGTTNNTATGSGTETNDNTADADSSTADTNSSSDTTDNESTVSSPKTGDNAPLLPFAVSCSAALILMSVMFALRRRKIR